MKQLGLFVLSQKGHIERIFKDTDRNDLKKIIELTNCSEKTDKYLFCMEFEPFELDDRVYKQFEISFHHDSS
mgnify:CR=1 FL=1